MYKYSFIFGRSALHPIGYQILAYGDTAFDATKEIIRQMNVINKAKGRTLITLDPDDYLSQGLYPMISALNAVWQDEPIVEILANFIIYNDENAPEVEPL